MFDDAKVLRPAEDGMRWIYDGRQDTVIYASDVRIAAAPSGLQETSSNVFTENTEVTGIRIESGSVMQTELIDFGNTGLTETLTTTELRSPVRTGDQYTALERNGLALNQDIDKDKVNDKADIAGWSRVVGMEDVELPALQQTISAVRVDSTLAIRIQRSTDGGYEATQTITQSSWYARDIGVIRRTLTVPGNGTTGTVSYDERLRAWDGLSRGVGAMLIARPPQAESGYTAYPALKALVLGDRALVLSGLNDAAGEQGLRLTVHDRGGRFLKTVPLPQSRLAINVRPQFVNCGAEACLLTVTSDSFGRLSDPQLLRFDREGAIQGPSAGTTLALGDYGSSNQLAAGDANGFWLMWLATTAPPGHSARVELRLQAFTASGASRSAHQVLEPGTLFNAAKPLSLTSNGTRAAATWGWSAFPGYQYKYAAASIGAAPTTGLLYQSRDSITGNSWPLNVLNIDDKSFAMLWPGPLFSGGDMSNNAWRGLLVNTMTGPVRATADSPDTEMLPSSWFMSDVSSPWSASPLFAAHSGAVFALSQGRGKLVAGSAIDVDLLQLSQVTPGSSALAAASPTRALIPAIDSGILNRFQASQILAFEDRVLIFGSNPNIIGLAFRR